MIDPLVLDALACPACDDRPPVRLEGGAVVCDRCGRRYPIIDGIVQMLVDSALPPSGGAQGGGVQPQ
ncbi:MAG: Trm112 family protein [Armatimonadetes bacterium]|nr:Trm112 family protein [Armatimonadota bacterium]